MDALELAKIRAVVVEARLPQLSEQIAALEEEIRLKQQLLCNLRLQEGDYVIEAAAIDRQWGRPPRFW